MNKENNLKGTMLIIAISIQDEEIVRKSVYILLACMRRQFHLLDAAILRLLFLEDSSPGRMIPSAILEFSFLKSP